MIKNHNTLLIIIIIIYILMIIIIIGQWSSNCRRLFGLYGLRMGALH